MCFNVFRSVCVAIFFFGPDIEPRVNASSAIQPGIKNSLGWSRSDNSFKFDFITKDGSSAHTDIAVRLQESSQRVHHTGSTAITEQGSGFAFNFKIPEGTEEEMTDTVAALPLEVPASDCNKPTKEDKPQQNEPHASSKAKKKKKKSGNKKKTTESTEQQEEQTICSSTISEARGDEGTALVSGPRPRLTRDITFSTV